MREETKPYHERLKLALAISDIYWTKNEEKFYNLMAEYATMMMLAGVDDDLRDKLWREAVIDELFDGEGEVCDDDI